MTPEEQRDNLLQAALEYINAVNNHVLPVEFADVRAARERLENVAFKVAHEVEAAREGSKEYVEREVGSDDWWLKGDIHGRYGIIHKIVDLVVGHRISSMKAVELAEALFQDRAAGCILDRMAMSAPWKEA